MAQPTNDPRSRQCNFSPLPLRVVHPSRLPGSYRPLSIAYTESDLPPPTPHRLRVAAIRFLNPAPLMWDFEHPPENARLAARYDVHYTLPALCADDLLAGRAGLGLIPVASLTPELAIVRGCVIASLAQVRSILLIVRGNRPLADVRSIATDTASRSSVAYTRVLFRRFLGVDPQFHDQAADPIHMLQHADAALLIGDPALLAREACAAIETVLGPCQWIDLAEQWKAHTGLPWVAAVWAADPAALSRSRLAPEQVTADLLHSRDAGLRHIDSIVEDWTARIALPPSTIHTYLTHNIHYRLDDACIAAIHRFRAEAAAIHILPPLPELRFLS